VSPPHPDAGNNTATTETTGNPAGGLDDQGGQLASLGISEDRVRELAKRGGYGAGASWCSRRSYLFVAAAGPPPWHWGWPPAAPG